MQKHLTRGRRRPHTWGILGEKGLEPRPSVGVFFMQYDLDADGFTFLRQVIPHDLLASVRSYARELLDAGDDLETAMIQSEAWDPKGFYRFCQDIADTLAVRRIALLPEIEATVAKEFHGRHIYVTDCAAFYNAPGVERLQYVWHREKDYFPRADEVLTLWFPWLRPVSESNGTMILARGSHKAEFESERVKVENGLTQMRIEDADLEDHPKVHCNLDLGDACLFRSKTVHCTGVNRSGMPRTSMIVRYSDWTGKYDNGWK